MPDQVVVCRFDEHGTDDAIQTITERAVDAHRKTRAKTPEAALYAVMSSEIAAKDENARFPKMGRGLFISRLVESRRID